MEYKENGTGQDEENTDEIREKFASHSELVTDAGTMAWLCKTCRMLYFTY